MKEREISEETIDNKKNRQKILYMCIESLKRRGEREDWGEVIFKKNFVFCENVFLK